MTASLILPSIGQENNTARLKTDKWFSFPSHLSSFFTVYLVLSVSFRSLIKEITPKIFRLCLVLINSVLLSLSCIWITCQHKTFCCLLVMRPLSMYRSCSFCPCCALDWQCFLPTEAMCNTLWSMGPVSKSEAVTLPVSSYGWLGINPFTAPDCKISGLKVARMRLQPVYFPDL